MMKKLLCLLPLMLFIPETLSAQSLFEFIHYNHANEPELGGNNFKAVAVGKDGHIWAGSQYHGLVKWDPTDSTWESAVDLSDVFISDIKSDHNGNIWVANAGRSGIQGGGSNIGGGISQFAGHFIGVNNFYTITGPGHLTSRNVRSLWVDKYYGAAPGANASLWVAQGTYMSSNNTLAGGFSVGKNEASPYFTKGYIGLQVTPYVTTSQARTPSLLAVGGNRDEVWIFAQANFNTNQIVRYRRDAGPHAFLGAYDYTNTPVLTSGFRANAIYFDEQERGWIGLQNGGVIIKSGAVWKTMNDPSLLPSGTIVNPNAITSDQQGNVYIGTSNGLLIYRGGAVDLPTSYLRVTTVDGLPTNNINGIAIDTFKNRIILAHSAGISFMRFKKKIIADLDWDHSFPIPSIKPKGVVTDGVCRLFIKIKRDSTTNVTIKKIALTVHKVGEKATAAMASVVGKLKTATALTGYSNEANTGTALEVSRTDSTPTGEFNFWYVAPDDFSADSLSPEANLAERVDSIKVKVTYENDTEDSTFVTVKLQRPPLMGGGMLSGIGRIFKNMKLPEGTPIFNSDLFIGKIGHIMNPLKDYAENISRLLGGDILEGADKEQSIQGQLENVRKMGYAANRVDFVAHGIGGNVARAATMVMKDKFYADGTHKYNNYGKGFFNKLISISVPHNGSPLMDMLSDISSKSFSQLHMSALQKILQAFPDTIKPYPVLVPADTSVTVAHSLVAKALMGLGKMKLEQTQVKNHLVVSNVEMDPLTPKPTRNGGGIMGGLLKALGPILRDISPLMKPSLTSLMDSVNGQLFKDLQTLNFIANLKGLTDFTKNSDLFSHVLSQSAGQPLTLPNITTITSDSADDITHENILNFGRVGRLLKNLLNTAINSAAFSDVIPADNTSVSSTLGLSQKLINVFFDTSKIVTDDRTIITNQNLRTNADPTLVLKYRIKDTVGLQYVYVHFQDSMYTTTSKARNQQVTLRIRRAMAFSGVQEIQAVGVYETTDSINYHADTIRAFVTPPTIEGFRVTDQEVELNNGNVFYPTYEVKVNNAWEELPSNDTAIKRTIEHPALLTYDPATLGFEAMGNGYTRTFFTYKTYKDTVSFVCLANSLTSINRSIVSGNWSDSATWSKGRPPLPADSIIITNGHTIVLNSSAQTRSLMVETGATLQLNQPSHQLQLGDVSEGDFILDNYGTLNIVNGKLKVMGRVKFNTGSTFNMTGGQLEIDGNTGYTITSLQNGAYLFEAAPAMNLFTFTGGTLQLIDPPLGTESQAINCPYSFGPNSTLILGNGISATASGNPSGFGGSLFPPEIGRLVLDAGNGTNRVLKITKPLQVKGRLDVKAGSHLDLQAPLTITQ